MRKCLIVSLLSVCCLILVACSSNTNNVATPLNNKQLGEFIKSHQLNVTAIEEVGNQFTVIMFENADQMGFHTAFVQNGEISSGGQFTSNNTDTSPVSTGGVVTGIPFFTISINDEQLKNKADQVKVIWEDGHESIEPIDNRAALVIPYDNKSSNISKQVSKVYLLDESGGIIFEVL